MSTPFSGRRAIAARVLFPILVIVTLLLAIPFTTANFADDPPPPPDEPPISGGGDMDGDDVKDSIEPDPDPPGNSPGEVEIRSGDNGTLIVRISGGQINDRFGYSVAVVDDLNQDGHKDLIIGAPHDSEQLSASIGRAYVFYGPFLDSGPLVINAENADRIFFAPQPGEYDFGDRVAPISDLDGDGVTDLRIRCWYVDDNQQEAMRTYIASGLTGGPLFVIEGQIPFDPWPFVEGDADGDGDCDQKDMDVVMANLGLVGDPPEPGSLSRGDGDLTGDGTVDGMDVAVAQAGLGTTATANFGGICPTDVPDCCSNLPPGTILLPGMHCRIDCTTGVEFVLGTNIFIHCDPYTCPGTGWCNFGIGGAPQQIDLNLPEVTLTTGGTSLMVDWFVMIGADRIELLSSTWNQSTLKFRPLDYGPIHIRATHTVCNTQCEANWYGEIVCEPDIPCNVEIIPPGHLFDVIDVCVLSDPVEMLATGQWTQGSWTIGLGAELLRVYSQPEDQQLSFSPRKIGIVNVLATNTACGDTCEDYLTIRILWIDTDGDGLPNGLEEALGLDPFNPDSDGDGTLDGWEDSDDDGFFNMIEVMLGFDADEEDSDGDEIPDGDEDPDEGDGGVQPCDSGEIEFFSVDGITFLGDSITLCNSDDPVLVQMYLGIHGDDFWSVMEGQECVQIVDGNPDQDRFSPIYSVGNCPDPDGPGPMQPEWQRVVFAGSSILPDGSICTDTLTINFASVDLDIEGTQDSEEENPGGYVRINADNDNGSTWLSGTTNTIPTTRDLHTHPIPNENDLAKLTFTLQTGVAGPVQGSVRVRVIHSGQGRIKIWDTQSKNNEVPLTGGQITYPGNEMPSHLYVEGTENSVSLRDIEVVLNSLSQL